MKLIIATILLFYLNMAQAETPLPDKESCSSTLNYNINMLKSNSPTNLCDYQDKVILAVNTATGCGFTPQLKGLEALYQAHKDQGLVIIGFPSNSFFQEPMEGEEIAEFCQLKYGVSFPMTEKISVKGEQAHPFFKNLLQLSEKAPQWNFSKYLINRKGQVVGLYPSTTKPDSVELTSAIQAALQK